MDLYFVSRFGPCKLDIVIPKKITPNHQNKIIHAS